MAPNPVAVLRSYVDGDIGWLDERIRPLLEIGWVSDDGNLTIVGARYYAHGWDAGRGAKWEHHVDGPATVELDK